MRPPLLPASDSSPCLKSRLGAWRVRSRSLCDMCPSHVKLPSHFRRYTGPLWANLAPSACCHMMFEIFERSIRDLGRHLTGMDSASVLVFAPGLRSQSGCDSCWSPDLETMQRTSHTLPAGLGGVERVDVLSFHQMDRFKWKALKLKYTLTMSVDTIERACAQFRSEGLRTY